MVEQFKQPAENIENFNRAVEEFEQRNPENPSETKALSEILRTALGV
jgi:hypothetical protein